MINDHDGRSTEGAFCIDKKKQDNQYKAFDKNETLEIFKI